MLSCWAKKLAYHFLVWSSCMTGDKISLTLGIFQFDIVRQQIVIVFFCSNFVYEYVFCCLRI